MSRVTRACLWFALFNACFTIPRAEARTLRVCPDGTGDATTIQDGIDLARNGDVILVCPGTYAEAFDLRGKAIHLLGEAGASVTVVDATGLDASVVTCTSFEGPGTVIEGLTLTGGTGTPSDLPPYDIYGGGLYARFSNPSIVGCVFRGNTADLGGGMLTFQSPETRLVDCVFEGNHARLGGGFFNNGSWVVMEGTEFRDNTAEITGGGLYTTLGSMTVAGGLFSGNVAGFDGGGMYNSLNSSSITGVDFRQNTAGYDGGGMYNWSSTSLVDGCEFEANVADRGGGMLNFSAQPIIGDSEFEGNEAREGAAIYSWDSNADMENLTIVGNTATAMGGGIYASSGQAGLRNSILWGNAAPTGAEVHLEPGASLLVGTSDIRGSGGSAGWSSAIGTDDGGNIDADPLFVAPERGLYMLSSGSPCIDAANNGSVPAPVTRDLSGRPRFHDDPHTVDTGIGVPPLADMGAYEYSSRYRMAPPVLSIRR